MLATWVGVSVLIVPVVLGEELGWRGYLQLRLFPGRPLTAALATGLLWGIWHYPLILSGGEPMRSTGLTLVALTVSTMTFSVFLGWVRSVTGSVWTTSAAHASNNVTGDSLQHLSFTGHQGGALPDAALVPALLGEALVWGATLGVGRLRRSRPSSRGKTLQLEREPLEPGAQAVLPGHRGHSPGL
jgi:membrane protease YdiL (CAAX protease family)